MLLRYFLKIETCNVSTESGLDRYRFVVQVVFGEQKGGGVKYAHFLLICLYILPSRQHTSAISMFSCSTLHTNIYIDSTDPSWKLSTSCLLVGEKHFKFPTILSFTIFSFIFINFSIPKRSALILQMYYLLEIILEKQLLSIVFY